MAQHGEEYLAVLKASYDYEPQSEDEITIKENQIVFLLEKTDDDWWKVKVKGDSQDADSLSGLVPAAYVEQAEHTSSVKALYDYDAAAPGELSIKEGEILLVFDREDDWILVQSQKEGGKAGFVPGNYVEESTGGEELDLEPAPAPRPQIIVPPSPQLPARPVSVYVDPADRVAQAPVKAQADDIKTWAVSEVDKKGKKKKGTLGIGNGSLFFASESDKTPVQKWDTAGVEDFTIERHKHVLIDMGGASPMKLHFSVGKEEIAEAILTKLDDSRKLATSSVKAAAAATAELDGRRSALTPPPRHVEADSPSKRNGVSVRFTEESPQIIPPREPSEDGEAEGEEESGVGGTGDDEEGESAVALYDFEGTSSDELSVQEGEPLHIIEKEGEEWWKCRNAQGVEGVVPASYLESSSAPLRTAEPDDDDSAARAEDGASAQAKGRRQAAERKEHERQARERAEKERKHAEQERAKAAAEIERKRQDKEEAAAVVAAQRKRRQEAGKRAQKNSVSEQGNAARSQSSQSKPPRDSASSTRTPSEQRNGPSPDSIRVWHDRSGQFRVEAALLGYTNGKLRLHKTNGVVIEVPSEKMSTEDMRYVEHHVKKKSSSSPAPPPAAHRASNDDDDRPLAHKRQSDTAKRSTVPQQKKGPQIDWFEFFLSAGCDVDDCTRYAHSFEKDKIDESLLPDITESTMRSLGLREGDIIRVHKTVQQKHAKPKAPPADHLASDEELAKRLQEEEHAKKPVNPAPNLFAGPGGVLKNNTQRRGRPQPSKSLPPPTVDLGAIGTASEQIKRNGSPLVRTSSPAKASPVQPPQRSSSAMTMISGFDDDAWTNRPGSKPPVPAPAPTPPTTAVALVAPAPQAAAAPISPSTVLAAPVQPPEGMGTGSLAKTTEADVFDQLARLSQLKVSRAVPSPAPPSVAPATSSVVISSPPGYDSGLGMGSSPAPLAQHLQNQQSGALPLLQQSGPRGPYAPVPANQGLLHPLIPTQTGFNSFISTRLSNASPFQPQPRVIQPSFLQTQPTGFIGNSQPLISQPTNFQTSGPLLTQPTGVHGGSFGNFMTTPFPNTVAPVQTNPTGFSPFGQSPFNTIVSTSPVPSLALSRTSNNSASSTTSPANVFAQMKSGTFASGNEQSVPQQAGKYDALRVNPQPTGWAPQATGWGPPNNHMGFQSGHAGF
ncbi:hypothetical protein PAXRUDRAFT_144937 [Paxillus rubicundulus Ve08.2h10]|uniref:Actin cytoskeleton-regulatory complex protein SLA1 n=1 Tax=Paxillus rubicundulus Ve08.2h10 TaxID=930991 RepID=A0A0D0E6U5_9AGAM|nr:hypothetical protein PAXRUDRAFT_144937 [Paxillus rubicundulus Ve08.2h10]